MIRKRNILIIMLFATLLLAACGRTVSNAEEDATEELNGLEEIELHTAEKEEVFSWQEREAAILQSKEPLMMAVMELMDLSEEGQTSSTEKMLWRIFPDLFDEEMSIRPSGQTYPLTAALVPEDFDRLQSYPKFMFDEEAAVDFDESVIDEDFWIERLTSNIESFPSYLAAETVFLTDKNLVYEWINGTKGVRGVLRLTYHNPEHYFHQIGLSAGKTYEIDVEFNVVIRYDFDLEQSVPTLMRIVYLSPFREVAS